jgi:hypothetical protein
MVRYPSQRPLRRDFRRPLHGCNVPILLQNALVWGRATSAFSRAWERGRCRRRINAAAASLFLVLTPFMQHTGQPAGGGRATSLGEPPQVLGEGGERELVLCTTRAA